MLSRFRHHQQHDRGQASLEWLAIVALVSGLLALGAGLAQADAVGRRVTREMARALCLVRDGDCRRDQEPCLLDASADRSSWKTEVAFVRHGRDHYALVEHRSDGTYAVTIDDTLSLGVFVQAGAALEARGGGIDVSVGGAITASYLAQLPHGRTWIARSEAEAQAILDAGDSSRSPDRTSGELASLTSIGVSGEIDALVHIDVGSASLTFDEHAGSIVDHRTGRRTIYVTADTTASAEALVLGSTTTHDAHEVYAVELSSTGRPLALTITTTDALTGSRDLPAVLQPVAGRLVAADADRYEVTAALDLTEPAALTAAADLFDAISGRRSRAKPSAELRRLVETSGTVEARILTADDETDSIGGGVTPGVGKLTLDNTVVHHEQRLLAAASRGLDGNWISREDCL